MLIQNQKQRFCRVPLHLVIILRMKGDCQIKRGVMRRRAAEPHRSCFLITLDNRKQHVRERCLLVVPNLKRAANSVTLAA